MGGARRHWSGRLKCRRHYGPCFFHLRKNETSAIFKDREAQDELRDVQGLIIDEAFMADRNTICEVIQICVQIPLRKSLRQRGALALFGYRHVLVF